MFAFRFLNGDFVHQQHNYFDTAQNFPVTHCRHFLNSANGYRTGFHFSHFSFDFPLKFSIYISSIVFCLFCFVFFFSFFDFVTCLLFVLRSELFHQLWSNRLTNIHAHNTITVGSAVTECMGSRWLTFGWPRTSFSLRDGAWAFWNCHTLLKWAVFAHLKHAGVLYGATVDVGMVKWTPLRIYTDIDVSQCECRIVDYTVDSNGIGIDRTGENVRWSRLP